MASSTDQDRRRRRKLHVSTVISRVLLAIILVLQVYPFVWLLQTSVKTPDDFASNSPFALPTSFTLDNFSRAISQGNLGTNILNSFIVTAASCLLIVICGMTGAYAIQVLDFRGSRFVRGLFLMGIVVPVQVALVPLFIDYSKIALLDTYQSMVIPLAGFALPMALYLFISFFSYKQVI